MKSRFQGILAVLVLGAFTGAAWAAEPGGTEADRPSGTEGLKVTSSARRQVVAVNEKGEKEVRLEDVAAAVPGEELVILITYVNQGRDSARNVVLVNPIPPQMSYVGGSASGEGTVVSFSVDGGRTYGPPESLVIVQADGTRRPAEPGEYTHIRWMREGTLPAGARGEAAFRVVIK